MSTKSDIKSFDADMTALEGNLGRTSGLAAQFNDEIGRIHQTFSKTNRSASSLESTLSRGLQRAIKNVVVDGASLTDVFRTLSQTMAAQAFKAAVTPITNSLAQSIASGVGSIFAPSVPFADGASFAQGRVMPFASGGIVSGPVQFPMRGGTGLMGEAGPEAIMPLARGPDGRLGVRAQGGGAAPVNIVMNISTPDVGGFRRSQSQIAAKLSRALGAGQRNS